MTALLVCGLLAGAGALLMATAMLREWIRNRRANRRPGYLWRHR